jgi:putative transposase
MRFVVVSLLMTIRASLRARAALQLEILALRHQLHVVNRSRSRRLPLTHADRMLWVWLSRLWDGWRDVIVIVKPETVLAWHRRGFRLFWTWKSRRRLGRPGVLPDVRRLIRAMAEANPLWGAPRLHGELLKLGIDVSQATVAKYMPRLRRPPSQTWRAFLANHIGRQIAAADLFVVPTATCRLLFVLVILAHERRRVVHMAVTAHPTAAWTAQQFREAFPGDEVPRYLIRDRDSTLTVAERVRRASDRLHSSGVPRSRDRRERNRVVAHPDAVRGVLPRVTDASLAGQGLATVSAPIALPTVGPVVAIPQVGGLHHRYERRAA